MRLVTYDAGDGGRAGMLVDGRVVDAWAALGEPHRGSLRELIEHGRIDDLRARIGDTGAPSHPLSAVRLLPPIPDPEKIICIGLNYAKHAEEGRQELPTTPIMFGKWRNALVADGATVTLPEASRRKSTTRPRSPSSSAAARKASPKPTRSTSSPATPSSTTSPPATSSSPRRSGWRARSSTARPPAVRRSSPPTKRAAPTAIEIELTLNGEKMQGDTTANFIFGVPRLVSYLSGLMTLEPGDIVATGTPDGVGGAREPRVWLGDGDELVVSSPTLGRLTTKIAR